MMYAHTTQAEFYVLFDNIGDGYYIAGEKGEFGTDCPEDALKFYDLKDAKKAKKQLEKSGNFQGSILIFKICMIAVRERIE